MFFLLSICAMFGYSIQNTLLAQYARGIDGLSLAFYRNISFSITLLPLLSATSHAEFQAIGNHVGDLIIAGLGGGLFLASLFTAYRFLPVGIAHTISKASFVIIIAALGYILFGEALSQAALGFIGIIIAGSLWLSFQTNNMSHLDSRARLGLAVAILGTIPLSVTFMTFANLTRTVDPLTAGYFWELSIGLAAFLLILLRSVATKQGLQRISHKDFLRIAACSSPTLIGTGCMGLALSMGPVALVSAIGSASILMTTLLAWLWYGEKLKTSQWMAITIIFMGVVALKFV